MNERAEVVSPLAMAYLGDAVFELCVRRHIIENYNLTVNKMNEYAQTLVNAASQAEMYHKVLNILTADEAAIIKRGRNAKANTIPKNADMSSYRHATGLEALFGYLYLAGKNDRIRELFDVCLEGIK